VLVVLVSVSGKSVLVLEIVVCGAAKDAPVLIVEKGSLAVGSQASTSYYLARCNLLPADPASLNGLCSFVVWEA